MSTDCTRSDGCEETGIIPVSPGPTLCLYRFYPVPLGWTERDSYVSIKVQVSSKFNFGSVKDSFVSSYLKKETGGHLYNLLFSKIGM